MSDQLQTTSSSGFNFDYVVQCPICLGLFPGWVDTGGSHPVPHGCNMRNAYTSFYVESEQTTVSYNVIYEARENK